MLFCHSQPEHYWPTPAEHYQNPHSTIYREPMQLPFLKQEDQPLFVPLCPAFQCILYAPSSPAIKLYEETLTYLNQGQSYEIRLLSNWKGIGDLSEGRRLLRSVVRVVFHDRRLQYSERQQLESWQLNHPGDRILDLDVPLSVGVTDPLVNPNTLNTIEFLWDPSKRTSVFIQVNCISTEFTQRKNGGEKGAPFRVQVDTYKGDAHGGFTEHLYSCSCQVKVFKPKGADRKQKTDREKVEKRSALEREKYQPDSETTVLTECIPWPDIEAPRSPPSTFRMPTPERVCASPVCASDSSTECSGEQSLSPSSSISETQQWLVRNRFSNYCRTFSNFTGADLLKFSRKDLTQICGVADGIRLAHSLNARSVRPRLTLYITTDTPEKKITDDTNQTVYQELYLEEITAAELTTKVADLFSIPANHIQQISRTGPHGIHILLSDTVGAHVLLYLVGLLICLMYSTDISLMYGTWYRTSVLLPMTINSM
ncbi:transcription factor CP2-like protein 1 isoform X1 [Xenopus laevis]|uniref:Upstream-binding protein 1 n=1 Tax=Xenopus laevis TaxID=8355 RepID=A0A8J1M029_XENLA|nr:transcription factor CP2-like protein 1 isoform X1 [Xenopus laevis]